VFHRDDLSLGPAVFAYPGDGESRPPKTSSIRYMKPVARSSEPRSEAGRSGAPGFSRSPSALRALLGSSTRWALSGTLLVVLLVSQGVASGATSVTPHAPAQYAVTHVGAPAAPAATVTATALRLATAALAALPAAGTQRAGAIGLAGTPMALPACLAAACRDRYIVASPAGLTAGDYSERVTFTLTQPVAPPGVSKAFLVEIVVQTSTGTIVGRAYVATGTTTHAGGAAITLQIYVNLGTAAAPTILSVRTVVGACSAATVCP